MRVLLPIFSEKHKLVHFSSSGVSPSATVEISYFHNASVEHSEDLAQVQRKKGQLLYCSAECTAQPALRVCKLKIQRKFFQCEQFILKFQIAD